MNFISLDKTPNAVLRRVDGNDVEAPYLFFIVKHYKITFRNSSERDHGIKSSACPATTGVIRIIYTDSWNITNENADHLFVNEKELRSEDSLSLKSGDKVRFKAANLDLTYSFQIFSEENSPTPFEMKSYLEPKLKALEEKADIANQNCARLILELDKLKNIQSNAKVMYPKGSITSACRVPMGAFKFITGSETPVFYFFDKCITTFGKSPACDIVIKSDECSSLEAAVRKNTKWQITNTAAHLLFVNHRHFKNGETLNIKSGDTIRFSGEKNFQLMYEFRLYLNGTFPTKFEAEKFLETEFNKLQEKVWKINQSCRKLQTRLESLKDKIKSELFAEQNLKDQSKINFVTENNFKKTTKVKRDETYDERSKKIKLESEGSKDIENKLLNSGNETLIVECEEVDASEAKIKKELVKGIETISETPAVKYEEMVSGNFKIKTELLEAFEIESKTVKYEKVKANEEKIKREPVEVIEIDCD